MTLKKVEKEKTTSKKGVAKKEKGLKTATLGQNQKEILKRISTLESSFENLIKSISSDLNKLFNRMDKTEALGDRHSEKVRLLENFATQVKPAIESNIAGIGEIKMKFDEMNKVSEDEDEEEDEES